jgi:inosine-uridine nucleoside N-ribohydrolase
LPEASRVVLDCDTANEVDDQFAIAHALGSPGALAVLGVVSVHNTTPPTAPTRSRCTRRGPRRSSPCATRPAACPASPARPMEDHATPVGSEGLDFILSEAERGPLTLVCTGPATDVASLALTAPQELLERLAVVWLGALATRRPTDATTTAAS